MLKRRVRPQKNGRESDGHTPSQYGVCARNKNLADILPYHLVWDNHLVRDFILRRKPLQVILVSEAQKLIQT